MFVLLLLIAYFVGAIPFGVIIARIGGIDILREGSGNPGATNVWRVKGWKYGLPVFLLDVLKGAGPGVAARYLITEPVGPIHPQLAWFLVGLAAVVGHSLSPFIGFKGGKGIATSLGAGLAAAPVISLLAFGTFIVLFLVTGIVSLASILAIASTLVWIFVIPGQSLQLLPIFVALTAFIIYRHRANIERLRNGTESRFDIWGKLRSRRKEEE